MKFKTPSQTLPLSFFALLLLLLVPVTFGLSGCQALGPQVPVADKPQQAVKDGEEKVAAARAALEKRNDSEATRLYNEAANYYAAVARKYANTDTGLDALLMEASLQDEGLKNDRQALVIYRNALRQYPEGAFPERHRKAESGYTELAAKMDRENAQKIPYKVLDGLVRVLGGSQVATIFFISIAVTLALWPLRARQYRSMKEMQRFQPQLKALQEKYKGDPVQASQKMREFQAAHGINPLAGCLPMVIQMPVLWGLYYTISLYQFQFTKSTFLWINPELGAQSASFPNFFAGAIARNLGEQDLPLLFIYALSMYLQTRLTPVSDPAQAEQQKMMAVMMPAMFFVMMLQWHLPSAFVLYWFISNILSVGQQWYINRSLAGLADTGGPVLIPADGPDSPVSGGAPGKLSANPRLVLPKNKRRK